MVESGENLILAGMMTRTLKVLIAVLVVLAALCVVVLRVAPAPDRKTPRRSQATGGAGPEKPGPYPTEYDEITVSIEIPPLSEFPAGWAKEQGCPQTRLTGALGAAVGPGNGCPVLALKPGGPAEKAGIKRFDRLGEPEDCPSTLYPSFRPGEETRTVEWTIRRPKGGSAEGAGAEDSTEEAEPGRAGEDTEAG